jgi:hypothetical protein
MFELLAKNLYLAEPMDKALKGKLLHAHFDRQQLSKSVKRHEVKKGNWSQPKPKALLSRKLKFKINTVDDDDLAPSVLGGSCNGSGRVTAWLAPNKRGQLPG